ncbi:MAG: polysaccharide deacetylase family protein [Gammaproteobacteria bacterium]|nr:polysaccharide deacetylase family protein [Gammaproteobacteria bacterium]
MIKNIYRNIYRRCPNSVKGNLSKAAMLLPNKPSVKPCSIPRDKRFPDGHKAAFVMSADFEMAWAWRYSKGGEDAVAIGLHERDNIPELVALFEKFNIPITWATVGHLFLSSCDDEHGKAHANLTRIPYFTNRVWEYEKGDWYEDDPCSNVDSDPAWYAPDLIRQVMDSRVGHEIGCHSFSHLDCTDARCPEKVMDDEITECVRLAREWGVDLRSMVFPGGTNGNYAVLARHGFTNYRINSTWDLFYPEKNEFGLWNLPSSATIENAGFGWTPEYYIKRYKQFIDKAIKTGTVCHLWFHPSIDKFCLREVFPGVLEYARKRADEGDLWIATMRQMTEFCEQVHG